MDRFFGAKQLISILYLLIYLTPQNDNKTIKSKKVQLMKQQKERLDNILVEKGFFETKSQAAGAILARKVKVNGEVLTKAGTQLNPAKEFNIEIDSMPYVSRGGFKLEKALKEFQIDLNGKICLDAGASTGGFTDCMLQNGASKVYAVDVGYGQIAWKLRNHQQVVVIEKTNIRNAKLEEVYRDLFSGQENELQLSTAEYAEFCAMDLSFISITKVLPNVIKLLNPEHFEIIALIKPQFEAEKSQVPKSGVIKDKNLHINIIQNIVKFSCENNLEPINLTFSPIQGPAGNIEYLIHLKKSNNCENTQLSNIITETVEKAHGHFNADKIKE
jgi:23S rRNA (cytidine1920-2'-O)/16S rRNA (cytidine1409-2'-O)-methyltransferase